MKVIIVKKAVSADYCDTAFYVEIHYALHGVSCCLYHLAQCGVSVYDTL